MQKKHFASHDAYIAAQPEAMQPLLTKVRTTVRKAVPGADEVISYGMPAFKLHGRVLLYYAGWRAHYAIYPSSAATLSAIQGDLAKYEVSKGTIRFEIDAPVPVKLITAIARRRAVENADAAEARAKKTASSARQTKTG